MQFVKQNRRNIIFIISDFTIMTGLLVNGIWTVILCLVGLIFFYYGKQFTTKNNTVLHYINFSLRIINLIIFIVQSAYLL